MEKIWLAAAIGAEVAATSFMKKTKGFTVPSYTLLCAVLYAFCYLCFAKCLEKMNLGIAYALWCGVGIIASALVSFFAYREKMSIWGVFGIFLILLGCIIVDVKG